VRATHAAPLVGADAKVVNAIEEAYEREHCLRIVYAAPNKEPTNRVVEPHLFWMHAGSPYLVAYCRSAKEFRTFAVQRIHLTEVLDESFDRRADFNATEFTERGFGVLHGEAHDIVIEFSREVAHLAAERRFHTNQRVSLESDGRAVLQIHAAGLPEIAAWLASFGGKVRALAPAELIAAVRTLHELGLAAYADAAAAPEPVSASEADIGPVVGALTSAVNGGSYAARVQSKKASPRRTPRRNGDA
jgi:predicted DNA-binding transcriptional regulator YafY